MPAKSNKLPPGPKGLPLLGLALQIMRDPLETLRRLAREYGDIVCIPVLNHHRILLNHPDLIEQVCVVQQARFHKSTLTKNVTERLLGQGLLISEGDFWRRQRRLAQPAFHRARSRTNTPPQWWSAPKFVCASGAMAKCVDITTEMMAMTLDIAVRTLFGSTLDAEAEQVGDSLGFLMRYSLRKARSPIKIPEHWPTPANRRAQRETRISGLTRVRNHPRAAGRREFLSPSRSAGHAHERYGRGRNANDAKAASRRGHDFVFGRT